jgi:hypothetical protein
MKALAHATVLAVAVTAAVATARGGGPPAFALTFDGRHAPATFASPNGLEHEGTFSTNEPRCSSGTAADIAIAAASATARRRFTCRNGDTFDALVTPLSFEHGGEGTWRIVGGTGDLASLRGLGTWTSVRTGGSDENPLTITFTSTWTGAAAADATAPVVSAVRTRALRLSGSRARLTVRLEIADQTPPLTFAVTVVDPHRPDVPLLRWTGTTSDGALSTSRGIRVMRATRTLRLTGSVSDAVGNTRALLVLVRLAGR